MAPVIEDFDDVIVQSQGESEGSNPAAPVGTSSTYEVKMVISLPLSLEEFTTEKQADFKKSIAKAAQAATVDVSIDVIELANRRQSGSVRIETAINAADKTSANAIVSRLTVSNINDELAKSSLPPATLIQVPTVFERSRGHKQSKLSDGAIAGICVGAVSGVGLILAALYYASTKYTAVEKSNQGLPTPSNTLPPGTFDVVAMEYVRPPPDAQTVYANASPQGMQPTAQTLHTALPDHTRAAAGAASAHTHAGGASTPGSMVAPSLIIPPSNALPQGTFEVVGMRPEAPFLLTTAQHADAPAPMYGLA